MGSRQQKPGPGAKTPSPERVSRGGGQASRPAQAPWAPAFLSSPTVRPDLLCYRQSPSNIKSQGTARGLRGKMPQPAQTPVSS